MARILVVDDQKIPRATVASMLREAGHEVETAAGGEEGLSLATSWSPDVIVLDVYMPGMDGFDVVERLKADPATAPVPVVFLTAEPPTDELVVRGLDLGAYDFISKGGSRAELVARVGVMARIKRGNDELSAIARISDTLIQTLDPHALSERFVSQIRNVFRADAVLLTLTPKTEAERIYAGDGIEAGDPLAEDLAAGLLERTREAADGIVELDPQSELRGGAGAIARRLDFRSAIAASVPHETRPPALLAVFSVHEGRFIRGSDPPLLRLLARQANIALDNAFLHVQTQEQREAIEAAMTQRSRFFASMSHELRTPINAVIGYNQLLELGTYGELNEKQAQAVENVRRSADHLLELINDVLDISKIEAGKLEVVVDETDVSQIVRDTVSTIHIAAREKGLDLDVDIPDALEIETDAARVRQVLLNLLSNAVKFTDEGRVAVEVERLDHSVEIRVSDTGPGIPPEDRDRIFEEFEQSRGKGSGGTGLGLAISRRLAHLLGGELTLSSELGEGSIFTLRLPLQAASRAQPEAAQPA